MKAGIVRFPGSNRDEDAFRAVPRFLGTEAGYLWPQDPDPPGLELGTRAGGFRQLC